MELKDIVVHLNASKHCGRRVDYALALAKRFNTRVAGLYVGPTSDFSYLMAAQIGEDGWPSARAWVAEWRNVAKLQFEHRLEAANVAADWHETEGDSATMMARFAHHADATIVGQADPNEILPISDQLVAERVVLEAGGPVLVIPYEGEASAKAQRVLVAWKASAQAARAVHDALPLLKAAEEVVVLSVNAAADRTSQASGMMIVTHLRRHGITAALEEEDADERVVGEIILSRAEAKGTDLVVAGAYGHSRAREMILGGVTRDLLQRAKLPVFLSH